MALETEGVSRLELEAVIGFNGHVPSGLRVHPNGEYLIYPLGCSIIIKKISDSKQEFLHGHSNNVSCLSVSKSGQYIASGEVSTFGFKAKIVIWDFANRSMYAELLFHKVKIEALAFSPSDKYLVSLGSQDDDSIVLWNIETKQAICGSAASAQNSGHCLTVKYSNTNDNVFYSAGSRTLRGWELDLPNRKIRPTEIKTGKLVRIIKCLEITENDNLLFCGTTSGDILKINPSTRLMIACGPVKVKYSMGVNTIRILKSGNLLVGSGSGIFAVCSGTTFKTIKKVQLAKGVTSIAIKGEEEQLFVGTEAAQIYCCDYDNFQPELIASSHYHRVTHVAIPFGTSELFATSSLDDIRLWRRGRDKELLRITVPNMTCNAVEFMLDGHSIISGWNDGKIRVFGPESGQLYLTIEDAHRMGVTAIAGTKDCKRIVSGGADSQVRIWELERHGHQLLVSMKEHKGTITCVKIMNNDKECVTASVDGACIIWDIVRFVSLRAVIANTRFNTVCCDPEDNVILTSGTDRKVVYWDLFDGSTLTELKASESAAINCLDITQDGNHFATGGDDQLVKVWDYKESEVTHVGTAHGGNVTSLKICSNNRILVSTSADGAILLWKFPHPPLS